MARPRLWLQRLPLLARGRTNETELDTILARGALPLGENRLTARPHALLLDLTATEAVNTTTFEEVVTSRIEHVAFREELYFMWN
ncbi:DUF2218 domain-containing protein [Rhodopseudomonas palustris]|uniref:DUF2218 domain-containing protein n=1 Tax=Rhodopseudomonas palustris TaxID=1076 RepID=UPI0024C880BF|nr:DUF2218 domain-containing protein [Rhodopseudomonas palustris]UYO46809.1 DUF2218 domain-containing protein [Rhodopseudomonas palustris]